MVSELPEHIECRLFAADTIGLDGTVAAARLTRIAEPFRISDVTRVELRCAVREGGGYDLHGRIRAPLEARCQRCLEWMPWPIDVALELVAHNRAPLELHGDNDTDWIELADGILPLREMLEDEVLLNCPFAPLHDLADCAAADRSGAADIGNERKQPFAGLADLLKHRED